MNKFCIMTMVAILMIASAVSVIAASGDVMIANFLFLRMRCPAGGYTAEQRADAIQTRANELLTLDGLDLSTVTVSKVGKEAAIYAGGRLLVTVHECDARANKTTPMKLAQIWADRFREIYPSVVPIRPTEI